MSNPFPLNTDFAFFSFFFCFVWVLHFLVSPRLYLKWRWNSGIYENFTLTNTNAIFFSVLLINLFKTILNWILFSGPVQGKGLWGARPPPQPLFEKKIELTRWCSIRTNNGVFFIKVLESPRSYDFLKQIELHDIVDNISGITSAKHDKWIFPDLQASAGKSCNHRRRKRSFSAARRLKTWSRSAMVKKRS